MELSLELGEIPRFSSLRSGMYEIKYSRTILYLRIFGILIKLCKIRYTDAHVCKLCGWNENSTLHKTIEVFPIRLLG